jgi:hypothetical protein
MFFTCGLSTLSRALAALWLLTSLTVLAQPADTASPPVDAASAQRACRADASTLCRGVRPGGGRLAACLASHHSELSPACQAALPQSQPCLQALRKLCGDVPPGDRGALQRCAREHADEWPTECPARRAAR